MPDVNAKLLILLGAGLTLYLFLTRKASAEAAPGAVKKLPPGGRTSATLVPSGPQRVIGGTYDRLPSLQAELQKRAQAVDQAQRVYYGAQSRNDQSMMQDMASIIYTNVPIIEKLQHEIDAVKNQAGVTG